MSAFRNQPGFIGNALGMRPLFQDNLRAPAVGFGNLVLTSCHVLAVQSLRLPNDRERAARRNWFEARGAQIVRVETGDGALTVVNTHWSLSAEDRLLSADRLAEALAGVEDPLVVAGDLNANADSPEVLRLVECGYSDAGAAEDRPTFPSWNPNRRIDFLLSRGLRARSFEVLPSLASDHLPLVAEWAAGEVIRQGDV